MQFTGQRNYAFKTLWQVLYNDHALHRAGLMLPASGVLALSLAAWLVWAVQTNVPLLSHWQGPEITTEEEE